MQGSCSWHRAASVMLPAATVQLWAARRLRAAAEQLARLPAGQGGTAAAGGAQYTWVGCQGGRQNACAGALPLVLTVGNQGDGDARACQG